MQLPWSLRLFVCTGVYTCGVCAGQDQQCPLRDHCISVRPSSPFPPAPRHFFKLIWRSVSRMTWVSPSLTYPLPLQASRGHRCCPDQLRDCRSCVEASTLPPAVALHPHGTAFAHHLQQLRTSRAGTLSLSPTHTSAPSVPPAVTSVTTPMLAVQCTSCAPTYTSSVQPSGDRAILVVPAHLN
jgi:hypothetical protein